MSVRTRQRREKHPTELLNRDQTGRAWKFAEHPYAGYLGFWFRKAAEQWLAEPATGLDQRRPIDLLTTPAGVMLVEDFLRRIVHGVSRDAVAGGLGDELVARRLDEATHASTGPAAKVPFAMEGAGTGGVFEQCTARSIQQPLYLKLPFIRASVSWIQLLTF